VRRGRLAVASVIWSVMALLAAACADDTGTVDEQRPTGTTRALPTPTLEPGTTMAAIQQRGKIIVGTKFDQPGFGQKNPTTGQVEGFDVEIAKLIAVAVFGGSVGNLGNKIEFIEAVSANREPFIRDGRVDMVVATYTINDARKQVVDFAGPYFVARQDILVRTDDTSIRSVEDLNGKRVCTVQGSTSERNLRARAPQADVLLFAVYSACAEALGDGRVAAVTTDAPILAGLAQASGGRYKLVNNPFSDEPYGIGLKKGANEWRAFINDRLEQIYNSGEWAEAFAATLGRIGLETPEPPAVDRYQ
jgi:glutamate transport system substrate-binding protein